MEYLTIWLPLLLQSFKHDAVSDTESEIGASTMLVSFLRSNENIVWLSSDSDG